MVRNAGTGESAPGYPEQMVRTLQRHGRYGSHGAAVQTAQTAQAPEAGPDEQVEQQAPDTLTDLPKRSWGAVLKGTVKEFRKDELTDLAAALTCYGILALFPALLALISLLGVVGQSASQQVLDNIQNLAPGAARDVLRNAVQQMQGNAGIGSVMAIVVCCSRCGRSPAMSPRSSGQPTRCTTSRRDPSDVAAGSVIGLAAAALVRGAPHLPWRRVL